MSNAAPESSFSGGTSIPLKVVDLGVGSRFSVAAVVFPSELVSFPDATIGDDRRRYERTDVVHDNRIMGMQRVGNLTDRVLAKASMRRSARRAFRSFVTKGDESRNLDLFQASVV